MIYQLLDELWDIKVRLLVDNGAAHAALVEGAAGNKVALTLAFTLSAVAARYDIAV